MKLVLKRIGHKYRVVPFRAGGKQRHRGADQFLDVADIFDGLRRQMRALKVMEQTVQDAPDQQVSLTDPDARSMATSGKGTATVGYNVLAQI